MWVDCIRERCPVIHNDYATLPHRQGLPEGHVAVIRELVVPIFREGIIVAILGVGNKPTDYIPNDVAVVSNLADLAYDLAGRKRLEENLRRMEADYRTLADHSPDLIARFDTNLRHTYVNPAAARAGILAAKEYIGKTIPETGVPAPDAAYWEERIRHVFESGEMLDVVNTFPTPLGLGYFHTRLVPEFAADGRVTSVLSLARDVTARQRAVDALRESEARYRNLFDMMEEGLAINELVRDEDGDVVDYVIVEVNPSFERQSVFERVDVVGKLATDIYQMSPAYIRDWWKDHTQFSGSVHTEYYHQLSKRWFDVTTTQPEGNRFATIFTDITERKQAEEAIHQLNVDLEQRVEERTQQLRDAQEQLVRQEKLAMLGQMAGSVGHELRSPLTVINNAAYFLKLVQPDADPTVKEYLNLIEAETQNAEKIITELLDFARIKSVDRAWVAVADLLSAVLNRFPPPASVTVSFDTALDLPRIFVDPRQMEQVLGNLVQNAQQAMKQGGILTLAAHVQEDQMAISVGDTGDGIPAENMPKLFEPLFTTKPKGIGLGLAVSQKLADANGGRMEVQSEVGVGSVFTLWLPIGKDAQA